MTRSSTEGQSSTPAAVVMAASGPPGRLAVLTGAAMASAVIPIPFLPERFISRVRGAVVQDVAMRHSLSLSEDARGILAAAKAHDRATTRRAVEGVARYVLRRVRLVGAVATLSYGVEVFALGHLFERYIVRVRKGGPVRIDAEEARRIRSLIDRAVLRAFAPGLRPEPSVVASPIEDLRDDVTRWIDSIVLAGATLPEYIVRRIDAALDAILDPGK